MHFKISAITASLLVGIATTGFASPASALNAEVTTDLNMRMGPGTRYPVVDTIPDGREVRVYNCVRGYDWCDVRWRGDRGWVFADYLRFRRHGGWRTVPEWGARIDLPIVTFSIGDYAHRHYRNTRYYDRVRRWARDHDINFRVNLGDRDWDRDRDRDRNDRDRDRDRDRGDRDWDRDRDRDRDRGDRDWDRDRDRDANRGDNDRNRDDRNRNRDRDANRGDSDRNQGDRDWDRNRDANRGDSDRNRRNRGQDRSSEVRSDGSIGRSGRDESVSVDTDTSASTRNNSANAGARASRNNASSNAGLVNNNARANAGVGINTDETETSNQD